MCAKSKQNASGVVQSPNYAVAGVPAVLEPKPEKPKLRAGTGEFRLTISDTASKKINELCAEIRNIEWSGTLFYKVISGNINDIANLHIEVIDLYLQDIGNAGYTEYEYEAEYANFLANNLELMDAYAGHIHSHHNMGTFFSPTDDGEVIDSTLSYPGHIFLSLIVNNAGVYNAKLGVLANVYTKGTVSTTLPAFELEDGFTTVEEKELNSTIVIAYKAKLDYVKSIDDDLLELHNRIKEIKAIKAAKPVVVKAAPMGTNVPAVFGAQQRLFKENDLGSKDTPIEPDYEYPIKPTYFALSLLSCSLFPPETLYECLTILKKVDIADYNFGLKSIGENLCGEIEDAGLESKDDIAFYNEVIKYLKNSPYHMNKYVTATCKYIEERIDYLKSITNATS